MTSISVVHAMALRQRRDLAAQLRQQGSLLLSSADELEQSMQDLVARACGDAGVTFGPDVSVADDGTITQKGVRT